MTSIEADGSCEDVQIVKILELSLEDFVLMTLSRDQE